MECRGTLAGPGSALLGFGFLDHAAGLGVTLFDVLLQHLFLDAPLPPTTHLDGFQFSAANQGISRRRVDLQLFSNIGKGEESGHGSILPLKVPFSAVIHSLMWFGRLTFVPGPMP